ncbi:MAG TPA: hypothetical protein VJ719_02100 [Chthoniobacterales bacterium]|nr:hypothetical protein [Chthoniobacterales bacterium]
MLNTAIVQSGALKPRVAIGFSPVAIGIFLVVLGLPGASAEPASPAPYPRPGSTQRASVPYHGGQANLFAFDPAISLNGRITAWDSYATDFVPADTNELEDVFARNLVSGSLHRLSIASNGGSSQPAVSGDGRYVAFTSDATNLVEHDGNHRRDVFVHDLVAGTIERVSVSNTGAEADDTSLNPALSFDGRFVAFMSYASNLVPAAANLYPQIYVRDRITGTTELVSVSSNGEIGDGGSLYVDISSDGRYVAFSSAAENLVPNDSNLQQDVFFHDRETGQTEIVSISTNGTAGEHDSRIPSISDDGRFVAFESIATTLVPEDTNGASDIFVRDRASGVTRRVSVTNSGAEAESGNTPFTPGSYFAAISPDGRYVVFQSDAPNLMADDTIRDWDVFVHDLMTGNTTPAALGLDGLQPNKGSGQPEIGADGRYVALLSKSTNLVPEGNDDWEDVFVHDRGPSLGIGGLSAKVEQGTVTVQGWATFSGTIISSGSDPVGDGETGAAEAGADLSGANVSYRPENGDIFVRLTLATLPNLPVPGAPAVLYGLRFHLAGTTYEVRAVHTAVPAFALYRCDSICTQQATLSGGIGTAGFEVSVAVPLSLLNAQEGAILTQIEAFTAFGDAAGPIAPLDQANLPDATVPVHGVFLGMGPEGGLESQVAFDTPLTLVDGHFAGVSTLGAGQLVWARACLGAVCGPAVAWPISTKITSMSRRQGGGMIIRGTGLPNETMTLYAAPDLSNGFEPLATVMVNSAGEFEFEDDEAANFTKRFYRVELSLP